MVNIIKILKNIFKSQESDYVSSEAGRTSMEPETQFDMGYQDMSKPELSQVDYGDVIDVGQTRKMKRW